MGVMFAEAAQVAEHAVQAFALDELHGVEMHAVTLAHAENGDNVGVMQTCGRAGLALKPNPKGMRTRMETAAMKYAGAGARWRSLRRSEQAEKAPRVRGGLGVSILS
jgi:hypothetical protein